jgi:DNA-binding response OmpR family regulator
MRIRDGGHGYTKKDTWMQDKDTSQSRKTVCLVDDEVDITTVVKRGLEQDGFIVHEYNDPIKAWEYFKENGKSCTIVLSDVRMPGMNGFEFCRRVKELRPEAPVLLMTAFEINQSEFSKVMPHTTSDGFMAKPISLKKLKEFINEITSKAK